MALLKKSTIYKCNLILLFSLTVLSFLFSANSFAQFTDTASKAKNISQKQESSIDEKSPAKPKYHSPKLAALMSTIIPGSGQIYNGRYWKVPVLYAGIAGLAYSFNFNQTKYRTYLDAYKVRIDGDPSTVDDYTEYTDAGLNTLQQYYHRYRNLTVIGAGLLYIMNIVDATVDAHMFTFDVSDNLSFNLHPTLINTAYLNHHTSGLSLKVSF